MTSTRIIITRHGETEWNSLGRAHGRTDIPLSKRGEEQAELLAERLAVEKIDAIYSSPLLRARDGAGRREEASSCTSDHR